MTLTKNSEEVKDFAALINLPPGWCWIPFEEITINYDGKRIPITSSARKPGVFPYYGASGIIDYVDDYLFDGDYLLIAEDGANLLSRSTPIAFEANGKFWVNNHAHIVQVPGELIPLSYLKEYFNFTDLRFHISGSAQPKLNQKNLNRIEIPLAPLNEKRRIVAKIKALKARSQRVKEELEAIAPLLDQFRQSVLAAAFRGDLTADWREKNPDVETASVLLERIRAERHRRWEEAELEKMKAQGKTPKDDKWKEKYKEPESVDDSQLPELPDKWCWATLDQLLFSLRNGLSKRPEDQPPGIPILRISAVRSMEVNTSDIRFYPIDAAEDISSYLLKLGDLLFTRYNGSRSFVGVCGLVPNLTHDLLYPDKLIRGQVVDKLLCFSEYLELACNFGVSRSHIESHIKTSAGQQGIAGSDLKCTPIPLPPVAEQYKIVQAVNQQFSATQSLAAMADESAKNVQLLDQSILAKAFRGELVPQDPNDEPASVLLERIRAEREKLDTKKKAKGKTEKKSRKAKPEAAEPKQLSLPGFE